MLPFVQRPIRRLLQLYAGLVLYALAIGPLVHVLLPRFTVPLPAPGAPAAIARAEAAG